MIRRWMNHWQSDLTIDQILACSILTLTGLLVIG
jgi:hypothetical protein